MVKLLKKWYLWLIIIAIIAISIIVVSALKALKEKNVDIPADKVSTTSFETELSCGNYTSGIDFPSGVYDIVPISGSGNISSNSSTGIINAMLGVSDENGGSSSLFKQEYKNMDLQDGTVLSVSSGLKIKITSPAAAVGDIKNREQAIMESVDFNEGEYVSGKDFTAGVYDIIAVSATGVVSSSNSYDSGINAMLGVIDDSSAPSIYEPEFKNVNLPEGTTLNISGVSVKLIPSK